MRKFTLPDLGEGLEEAEVVGTEALLVEGPLRRVQDAHHGVVVAHRRSETLPGTVRHDRVLLGSQQHGVPVEGRPPPPPGGLVRLAMLVLPQQARYVGKRMADDRDLVFQLVLPVQ